EHEDEPIGRRRRNRQIDGGGARGGGMGIGAAGGAGAGTGERGGRGCCRWYSTLKRGPMNGISLRKGTPSGFTSKSEWLRSESLISLPQRGQYFQSFAVAGRFVPS